jgi:hypothetical protein
MKAKHAYAVHGRDHLDEVALVIPPHPVQVSIAPHPSPPCRSKDDVPTAHGLESIGCTDISTFLQATDTTDTIYAIASVSVRSDQSGPLFTRQEVMRHKEISR